MLIQKIERVNSMTIRKMANEELSQCVDVIRKSYETEAVAFGITEMNCPQHAAFITLDRLQMSAEWGYVFYGAFEDDELIACFAIENKDDSVYELHLFSVLPDKRYGGVGAKSLEFAKNEVFSMGGTVLNAGAIHQSVSVRNWYEKNGFKQKEIHRAAYLPFALGIMSCNVGE